MTDEISIMSKRIQVINFIRWEADPELIQEVWQLIEDAKTIKREGQ